MKEALLPHTHLTGQQQEITQYYQEKQHRLRVIFQQMAKITVKNTVWSMHVLYPQRFLESQVLSNCKFKLEAIFVGLQGGEGWGTNWQKLLPNPMAIRHDSGGTARWTVGDLVNWTGRKKPTHVVSFHTGFFPFIPSWSRAHQHIMVCKMAQAVILWHTYDHCMFAWVKPARGSIFRHLQQCKVESLPLMPKLSELRAECSPRRI